MTNYLDKMVSRTIRNATEFAVTNRHYPAWLEAQLDAIEMLCRDDFQTGLMKYIDSLQDERDRLEAL